MTNNDTPERSPWDTAAAGRRGAAPELSTAGTSSEAEEWLGRLTAETSRTLDAELGALRSALAVAAQGAGVLDLAYRSVPSPIGDLLLVASPSGLVQVAFENEDWDAVLASLAARVSPRVLEAPERLENAARQLEEYFAGRRRDFEVTIDLSMAPGFRAEVVAHLPSIEFGQTVSYAAVAAAVGNPRAVRAVGSACAANPVPLFVPCHRVVRSDGTFGAYRGGHDAKRFLLEMEAAA